MYACTNNSTTLQKHYFFQEETMTIEFSAPMKIEFVEKPQEQKMEVEEDLLEPQEVLEDEVVPNVIDRPKVIVLQLSLLSHLL